MGKHFFLVILVVFISLSINEIGFLKNLISETISSQNKKKLISQKSLEQAQEIVVKIKETNVAGSGIIIEKTNNIYTIITNRHVVDYEDRYQIQTPDRQIYTGKLVSVSPKEDLAILQFKSDLIYSVATISHKPLKIGISLFTVGFPYNSNMLKITSGILSFQAEKPLKQGYQLGYTNTIHQGMSGGAILNSSGEVVGINGRSANPILVDYQYQDRSYPSEQLQQKMTQLSWGIPIIKAMNFRSHIKSE